MKKDLLLVGTGTNFVPLTLKTTHKGPPKETIEDLQSGFEARLCWCFCLREGGFFFAGQAGLFQPAGELPRGSKGRRPR